MLSIAKAKKTAQTRVESKNRFSSLVVLKEIASRRGRGEVGGPRKKSTRSGGSLRCERRQQCPVDEDQP